MKKINVIKENCIGCGACVAIDPEHFEFDEEGKSSVITNENIESENLVNAIESCPTCAIETIETEEREQIKVETPEMSEEAICECDECDCTECECHHHEEEKAENEN